MPCWRSNYPPAEPEALGNEPLRAALKTVSANSPRARNALTKRTVSSPQTKNARRFAPSYPHRQVRGSFVGFPLGCLAVHEGKSLDGLPETSNFYCHPGKAGGSPAYAGGRDH